MTTTMMKMMKDYDEDTAADVDNYDDVYDFAAVYCNGYDADDAAENGNKINKYKFNLTIQIRRQQQF